MHTQFSTAVAEWQGFYALAGGASATLVGLVFVSVSIQLDVFRRATAAPLLAAARRTFARFIIVLTIALLFLVPEQSPYGLGFPLLALGLVDMWSTVRLAMTTWGQQRRAAAGASTLHGWSLTPLVPLISGAGISLTAVSFVLGSTGGLNWMIGVIAVILANAAQEAWNLMFTLAKAATDTADATA